MLEVKFDIIRHSFDVSEGNGHKIWPSDITILVAPLSSYVTFCFFFLPNPTQLSE